MQLYIDVAEEKMARFISCLCLHSAFQENVRNAEVVKF